MRRQTHVVNIAKTLNIDPHHLMKVVEWPCIRISKDLKYTELNESQRFEEYEEVSKIKIGVEHIKGCQIERW
jgi:hypothetical protein